MSLLFSSLNIISQSQHDAEVANPTMPIPATRPSYLQVLTRSITQHSVDVTSTTRNSRSSEDWQDRISAAEAEATRQRIEWERNEERVLEASSNFRVGAHVYTTNPAVSSLPKKKKSKGKRRRRGKVYGKVVHRSSFQPRFWLVKFNNGKEYYCTSDVVTFVSKEAPNNGLSTDMEGNLTTKPFDYTFTNKEDIMTSILESKASPLSNPNEEVTFETVSIAYKGQYKWINPRKLKKHYNLCKHTLTNVSPISWAAKLEMTLKTRLRNDEKSNEEKSVGSDDNQVVSLIDKTTDFQSVNKAYTNNNDNDAMEYVVTDQMKRRRIERRNQSKRYNYQEDDDDSSLDESDCAFLDNLNTLKKLTDERKVQVGEFILNVNRIFLL